MDTSWYVIKVIPGKERILTEQFNQQIALGRLKNLIRFVCPTEKEFVLVKNKKILREKVLYSGYLYFESSDLLNEEELKILSNLPNVMGMMGDRKPILMKKHDVKRILKDEMLEEHIEVKRQKYKMGETIIINDGPFKSFNGLIHKINEDKLDIEVKIFGRPILINLSSDQVNKVV